MSDRINVWSDRDHGDVWGDQTSSFTRTRPASQNCPGFYSPGASNVFPSNLCCISVLFQKWGVLISAFSPLIEKGVRLLVKDIAVRRSPLQGCVYAAVFCMFSRGHRHADSASPPQIYSVNTFPQTESFLPGFGSQQEPFKHDPIIAGKPRKSI